MALNERHQAGEILAYALGLHVAAFADGEIDAIEADLGGACWPMLRRAGTAGVWRRSPLWACRPAGFSSAAVPGSPLAQRAAPVESKARRENA